MAGTTDLGRVPEFSLVFWGANRAASRQSHWKDGEYGNCAKL